MLHNFSKIDGLIDKFHAVYFIRKDQFNVAETYWVGTEGYRKLRRLLRHSRLNRHVDQTRYTAIGKHSRL